MKRAWSLLTISGVRQYGGNTCTVSVVRSHRNEQPLPAQSSVPNSHGCSQIQLLDLTFDEPFQVIDQPHRNDPPNRAFPYDCCPPAQVVKLSQVSFVPRHVGSELRLPEIGVARWCRSLAASGVSMPEAAVNEDDGAVHGKGQVGPSIYLF